MLSATLVLAASNPLEHVLPHELFRIGDQPISNHLVMTGVAGLLVTLVFAYVATKVRTTGDTIDGHLTHGRFAQLFETMCVFIRDQVAKPNLGHLTDKYIFYIWTVFFFILFANILGMVPIGYVLKLIAPLWGGDPKWWGIWGGTATSDLSLNVPLALMSLFAIVFIGVREAGTGYFAHFAPGPKFMWPLIVPLEVLSLLIKCCVLAVRLFGTMLAGHLVLAALVGMIFIFANILPALGYGVALGVIVMNLILSMLELFIACLQAFIFTFLTTLFISQGAVHHGDHGHDHAHDHEADLGPGQRDEAHLPHGKIYAPAHAQPQS